MISEKLIKDCSYKFTNGVIVVNTTPHSLSFLSPEGEKIVVPTSVPDNERTGELVINASPKEISVAPHIVDTAFESNAQGNNIIQRIKDVLGDDVMIVGSMIAANAYPDVVGMCPAPGFERVPPANKLMSCEKFTSGTSRNPDMELCAAIRNNLAAVVRGICDTYSVFDCNSHSDEDFYRNAGAEYAAERINDEITGYLDILSDEYDVKGIMEKYTQSKDEAEFGNDAETALSLDESNTVSMKDTDLKERSDAAR